jgi:hypothetical protein
MELRLLLLLCSEKKERSLDWLINMDFIICYAENFQLPYNSLHGNNQHMYGELSSRRMLAQEAVKNLVIKGLIDVIPGCGYAYKINVNGKKYAGLLKSEYATQYKDIAKDAIKMFRGRSDLEIGYVIQDSALKALKEGGR